MSNVITTSLLCIAVLTSCASKTREVPALKIAPLADFSGSWEIDYEHTENPQDRLSYLYEIAQSQFEQQQKMKTDRDGARPASGNSLRDLSAVIKLGTLADASTQSTVLTIDQSLDYISVKRSGDYALTCDFLAPANDLAIGQESCGLDSNGQLVFATQLPEGLTVINRYSLARGSQTFESKRLMVSTTLVSAKMGQSFSLNRVYRLFPPGKGLYACEYTLEKKKVCRLRQDDTAVTDD
ncbi:MAG: hypothetical protein QNL99_15050 [SAR86 cluster bacterium]|jgi:hypothetical protein|uniref:Uncharacterized protein n=1 Tax=SAR86 cluster bacterium TaxID=2030880 RepID=A0A972W082_9GAMM|nr:hypothetical protein [SAR86 cluster bacterium]|tara:strand:+ start:5001 stop:5717 length:717 start_codon:yes stop_codon:yes gene_type:complete